MKYIYTVISFLCILLYGGNNLVFSQFSGGSGAEDDPFIIMNAFDLDNVRDFPDSYFRQDDDIDFNKSPNDAFNNWVPIGGNGTGLRFTGHYDGNGKIISNVKILHPGDPNIGLFGHIGGDNDVATTIKNVALINVQVTGGRGTGALAGRVTGNQNTRIENCYVNGGTVNGDGATGGLVGSNNSYVTNAAAAESFRPVIDRCWANVTVFLRTETAAGKDKFGGLAGCNQKGLISNSYSRSVVNVPAGTRIGGLAGCVELRGIIINSYSTGKVTAVNGTMAGGLLGMLGVGSNSGTVSNCYWDVETSEQMGSAGGTGLTTEQMKDPESYNEWDFNTIWEINALENDKYPVLAQLYNPLTIYTWAPQNESNDWTIAMNWDQNSVPPSGAVVKIPETGIYPVLPFNLLLYQLIFEESAELIINDGYILKISGDIFNDDQMSRIHGQGAIELTGSGMQRIANLQFANLIVNNLNNLRMEGEIVIKNMLKMESGLLDLNGYVLHLDADAHLIESESENTSSRVFGITGYIETIRNLNNPSGEIGGLGLEIETHKEMGITTIRRGHSELNYTDESRSILRWFDIIPQKNDELNATLVFHYFNAELNLYDESDNFALFKSEDHNYIPGMNWIWIPSEVDPAAKTITAVQIESFSRWTAGISEDFLPVSLISFQAIEQNNSEVILEWVTASEVNNEYFTLERSSNANSWEVIATHSGNGTTSEMNYYSVTDQDPLPGLSYYRLQQTDFDGTTEVFAPVSIYMQPVTDESVTIYPNPGNGNFKISFSGEKDTECRIFDMQGKLVYSSILEAFSVNSINLSSQLPAGLYTVVIYSNEISSHKLFIR